MLLPTIQTSHTLISPRFSLEPTRPRIVCFLFYFLGRFPVTKSYGFLFCFALFCFVFFFSKRISFRSWEVVGFPIRLTDKLVRDNIWFQPRQMFFHQLPLVVCISASFQHHFPPQNSLFTDVCLVL
uniref:Transmembrane protein n=1 Tax=Cacopsylla melanoneura TaxID=428564 RepID=A0A8D8MHD9_9HEMI